MVISRHNLRTNIKNVLNYKCRSLSNCGTKLLLVTIGWWVDHSQRSYPWSATEGTMHGGGAIFMRGGGTIHGILRYIN